MSLALEQVIPVAVANTELNLEQPVFYGVYDSAQTVNHQEIKAISNSNSVSTYNLNPPSPYIAVSRKMYFKGQFTIVFKNSDLDNAQNILQTGFDALRAYPASQCMANLKFTINNSEFSIQLNEVLNELLRYQYGDFDEDSMTPNVLDESQRFAELKNSIRNPLAAYDNKTGMPNRGGFVLDSLTNDLNEATIKFTVVEPIMLSPFLSHCRDGKAFFGVQNMSASISWDPNLSRMWCHDATSNSKMDSVEVTVGDTAMLVHYMTPSPIKKIPSSLQYNLNVIEPHVTELNKEIADATQDSIQSNNIQFSSIPNKVYLYVKERRQDRNYTKPDAWCSIDKVNITFAAVTGMLSSAQKQQLYKLNRFNNNNQSWVSWSAEPTYNMNGNLNNKVNGPAGPLCLRFGKDLGLPSPNLAPGVAGTFQFAVQVTFTNRSGSPMYPALYIADSYEGLVTISQNTALQQIAVLSKDDVLDTLSNPQAMIDEYQSEQIRGGSFWSDLSSAVSKALPIVRKVRGAIQKYAPAVAAVAPEAAPYALAAKEAADVAEQFGLGIIDDYGGYRTKGAKDLKPRKKRAAPKKSGKKGGVLIGGKDMSRAELKRRMMDL